MKRFFLLLLIIGGLVYFYFWYVRGINLLLQEDGDVQLQSYTSFATRLPPKPGESVPDAPAWQSAAPMPTPRSEVGAAAVDGKIYVIGGIDSLARTLDTVEMFDARTNIWSIVAPLPKPLHHVAAVAASGKVYALGGMSGLSMTPSDSMFIYEPGSNSWSVGPTLPVPVGAAAAVVDGGLIRILGGSVPGGTADRHFVYDIEAGAWSEGEPLLTSRDHHAAAAIGGIILIAGGRQGNLAYNMNSLDIFRPDDRLWERWETMPTRRSDVGYVAENGLFYIFGGEAPTVTFDVVEAYDPETRKWQTLAPMPTARHGMAAVAVDGKIFVIGGGLHPGISVSDINEVFVPRTASEATQ